VGEPTPGSRSRYDRDVIWEPFVLALFLGLVVSAGLYFAYLWPSVEPEIEPALASADSRDKPDGVTESDPVVVAPPKLPDPALVRAKDRPPTRNSDADMTPLPPPQPEDDGVSDDEKAT
jgi:hypothetical protein